MSIRLKLAAAFALAGSVAIAAAAGVFVTLQRRSLQASEEEKVKLLLGNVRAMAQESQLANDPLMLIDYLAYLGRDRDEVARARARFDGRWVGPEPAPLAQGERLRVETVQEAGGKGRPAILVEVSFSRKILDERLAVAQRAMVDDLSQAAALVVLGEILLSFGLGWSLTSRLVKIERAMKDVGEGRLDRTVSASGSDEIARLARGLNAMAGRLKEVDEMKRTFVASVTHELRSPLFAIESYVKTLLRESKVIGEDERRQLMRIEANASRLAHFVTSLLDLAKIERGKLEFRPRAADFARVVEDSVEFHRSRAEECHLTLTFSADENLPALRLDSDLITQVVTNLVSNAIKFTAPGGSISVSARRRKDAVECVVSDTGAGIPAATLARLFRPFERGADPLRAGGTGLGLSIVKAIVERHGGLVTAESEPGRGSRFGFCLPLSDNKSLTPKPS
ncbi:MAG: ATP-binding protein [Elusimicrobiota bacterium]